MAEPSGAHRGGVLPGITVPRPVPAGARASRRMRGPAGTAWAPWRSRC